MTLSIESQKLIYAAGKEAGDFLKDKLKPCEGHPVRNPYAHVWERVKHHLGGFSYKDCDDEDVPVILELIKEIRQDY